MDNLDVKNIQLAYNAVYNRELCESMEEMGLLESSNGDTEYSEGVEIEEDTEYDVYDLVLEHLIEEGYAETLESAEAIMANMSEDWLASIIEEREPGVKPYRPNPTQAEVRANAKAHETKHKNSGKDKPGYGPESKFYKPEDNRIPDKDTAEWFRKTKKTFGRPIGKYDPKKIQLDDILKQYPENKPGGQPKPRRVIPSRLDKK